ncbi:MAG: hypothetical protein WAW37_06850 [Syntrophobacteraceae bacterium]
MKKSRLVILALIFGVLAAFAAVAQATSNKLSLEATIVNPSNGKPFPAGKYDALFEIYKVASAGTAMWSETRIISLNTSGQFSTVLGNLNALQPAVLRCDPPKSPATLSIFTSESRWLQITLSSSTLSPTVLTRLKLNTAAYAANCDKLDGLESTAFAQAAHTHTASEITSGSINGDTSGNVLRVFNAGTGTGIYGGSTDGVGIRAYSLTDYGVIGEGGGIAGVMARHLGSGNWVDNARSDLALKAYASATATGGGHGIEATSVIGDGLRSFTSGANKSGYYAVASGANGYGAFLVSSDSGGTGIYAEGGANGWAATFRGNVRIRDRATNATVMELGKGLDYAEGFNVTDRSKVRPGSVVVIDPMEPGRLSLSTAAYDSKVAGIVAGAMGLGSGVRLGAGEFDLDVALAGRVYCDVDASEHEIKPGDLLTTSPTPGHAMKAADHGRAQGAILGKAMQGLPRGKSGQILVLVTLQ